MLPGQIFCDIESGIESAECVTAVLTIGYGVFSIHQETWLHKLSSEQQTRHEPLWWTIFMEFSVASGSLKMACQNGYLVWQIKNSWIIWFRKWILFSVSEKSRWNDWRLFWRSQSCKNQSLICCLIHVLCALNIESELKIKKQFTKTTWVYFRNELVTFSKSKSTTINVLFYT
jgi:hypothetical protein